MMDTLSPFTRRLLALAILVVLIVAASNLVLVPVWSAFHDGLAHLADVRFQRAQAEAIATRPLPARGQDVPRAWTVTARTHDDAARQLSERVREAANRGGLTIAGVGPAPTNPQLPAAVAITISVEGPEVAMISFINRLEQGRPLLRFTQWHIARGAAPRTELRLDGRLEGAWSAGR